MYAFLLALGAVIAAAGVALLGSGVSIQDRAFDATNVTPAAIAVIGGCILIGLAFVVRALLRVERALVARPMPRAVRPAEVLGSGIAAAQTEDAARIPFPPKPKSAPPPQPMPVSADARPAPTAESVPSFDRLETAPVVEESDVSLLPKAPVRPEEENGVGNHGVTGRTNGAAHTKTAPRLAGRPVRRQQQQQPKGSIFDSLWPKAPRAGAEAQTVAAAPVTPPAPAAAAKAVEIAVSAPPAQPAPAAQPAQAALTVLKSGVVEGMAYTLYSDGSIEAQLPDGTLRFGSITELRNHIEQHG